MDRARDLNSKEGVQSIRFSVPEMNCPSCAGKVDKVLNEVSGIVEHDTQPTSGTVLIRYRKETVTESGLEEAIEKTGYRVYDEEEDQGEGEQQGRAGGLFQGARATKTWLGLLFLVAGLLLKFFISGQDAWLTAIFGRDILVSDLLLLMSISISGFPVVRNGFYSARNWSLDMDLLMGTAIVAATAIGFFMEAATLAVLFSIAELLEKMAMNRAKNSLHELMELSPDQATVKRGGTEQTVPVDEIQVGETVVVRPGNKIPLDGTVKRGTSAVDQSPITGESLPVDKEAGDEVFAGTLNESGYLEIKVTCDASDRMISRIVEMVQSARQGKTEKEQFVDRLAGYYTPVLVFFAIATAVLPVVVLSGAWDVWFVRGLTLLVIACPCAFVISTPVSVVSGLTAAARNGVLIKQGSHLEAMGEINAVAIDKTGTLTEGNLVVTDVFPFENCTREELLQITRSIELKSSHPMAEAVVKYTEDLYDDVPVVKEFENIPGKGAKGTLDGTTYYAGKSSLFSQFGLSFDHKHVRTDKNPEKTDLDICSEHGRPYVNGTRDLIPRLQKEGKSVIMVGTENELMGFIAIKDRARPEARDMVKRLHRLGVDHIIMLTGDNEETARAIAEEVGMDEFRADLLPEEKVSYIRELADRYGSVAMVGDGINDAPALASATVGIAMGAAGTDTALETADVALMADDLSSLPYLFALSRKANSVIRQNIVSSLGVKLILAVGVPLGYVTVALAVLVGDMGMSLAVTGNAMRLSRIKLNG